MHSTPRICSITSSGSAGRTRLKCSLESTTLCLLRVDSVSVNQDAGYLDGGGNLDPQGSCCCWAAVGLRELRVPSSPPAQM